MKNVFKGLVLSVVFICPLTSGFGLTVKEPVAIYLNGKQVNLAKDSLALNATGRLSLSTLAPTYETSEKVKFKVVLRKISYTGSMPFLSVDLRYNDGEEFTEVAIEKILTRASAGDQLLIIPVDSTGKFANTKTPFVIHVTPTNAC